MYIASDLLMLRQCIEYYMLSVILGRVCGPEDLGATFWGQQSFPVMMTPILPYYGGHDSAVFHLFFAVFEVYLHTRVQHRHGVILITPSHTHLDGALLLFCFCKNK